MAGPMVWLAWIAVGERIVRLWRSLKRAMKRKEERDKEEENNEN